MTRPVWWTVDAVNCYRLQGDCAKCYIPHFQLSQPCRMHESVRCLMDILGKPKLDAETGRLLSTKKPYHLYRN